MSLEFITLDRADIPQFKSDMQEAFQLGAEEGGFPSDGEIILPEEDIDRSLSKENATAYKAVAEGRLVGGAIVVTDPSSGRGYLDFLYVKHGTQSKGIGKFMWFEIERLHPEIHIWETCTPYFERRNIHFYINVCGFHAVEYFNPHHPDPHSPDDCPDSEDSGMFEFRKIIQ